MIRAAIRRISPPWAGRAPRGAAEGPHWPRPLVIALVAIACLAVIIPVVRHSDSTTESSATLTDQALATVDGVPQAGVFLGSAKAPARLVVYADLTSLPYADFQQKVLPTVVERYVKPGKVLLQFATTAAATSRLSDSSDAREAALLAQASGLQNKLWQFSGAFGAQYVGVLDDATATQILRSVPGLDRRQVLADRETPGVKAAVARDTVAGQTAGARGGLAFTMQINHGGRQELPVAPTPAGQIAAIDRLVASLPSRPGAAPGAETTPSSARLTLVPQKTELSLAGLRARVLALQAIPAQSAAGRAKHRIRLVVRLQVRNTGGAPILGGDHAAFVHLVLGGHKISEDRHVWPLPISFKQNKAIAPGKTRTGVLRFELGGKDGEYLETRKAGQIAIRTSDQPNAGGKLTAGVIRFSTG